MYKYVYTYKQLKKIKNIEKGCELVLFMNIKNTFHIGGSILFPFQAIFDDDNDVRL